MKFELYRISMVIRQQTSIFDKLPDGKIPSREEFLRKNLARDLELQGRGPIRYRYAYIQGAEPDSAIVAKIGRLKLVSENAPPESDFKPIQREAWQASHVIIDPTHHADGQKMAIEFRRDVGSTRSIAEAIEKFLNSQHQSAPYAVEIREIIDPTTFWQFAKENYGQVISADFELVAPNMFGIREEIDKRMQKLRDQERARTVTFGLHNPDGLNLHTATVEESVKYVAEGGGSIRARTKDRRYYSSKVSKKAKTVPEELQEIQQPSILQKLIAWVFG